jgi:hypothetical protein
MSNFSTQPLIFTRVPFTNVVEKTVVNKLGP